MRVKKENEGNSRKKLGFKAEEIAAAYLEEKGFEILKRNFRWQGGEIDIIAKDEDEVVFIEVRSLTEGTLNPAETISRWKKERIIRTALYYLAAQGIYDEVSCRFDFLGIRFKNGKPLIEHIKDAFRDF